MLADYPEWTLDEAIVNALDIWRDSRRDYWEVMDDPRIRVAHHVGEKIGDLVLEATEELWHATLSDQFRRDLEKLKDHEFVLEPIELALVGKTCMEVREQARRCLELAQVVVETRPAEPVRRYLRRLSRCYVAGFEPEVVVICRAVFENALKDAFNRKRLPLPQDEKGRSTMSVRIRAAVRFGLLPEELERDAVAVWKRGSKAAHEDPKVTKDILGTLRMTMSLVSALNSD